MKFELWNLQSVREKINPVEFAIHRLMLSDDKPNGFTFHLRLTINDNVNSTQLNSTQFIDI
jgi:hypothetical protein